MSSFQIYSVSLLRNIQIEKLASYQKLSALDSDKVHWKTGEEMWVTVLAKRVLNHANIGKNHPSKHNLCTSAITCIVFEVVESKSLMLCLSWATPWRYLIQDDAVVWLHSSWCSLVALQILLRHIYTASTLWRLV